jgi:iron complex outermembrane receptor protein
VRWIVIALVVCAAGARAEEFPEEPDAPSAFATRISARDYDDRASTVEQVLREVPGVRVRRFGGLGAFSTASIRGSKPEQVLVLLDGVPLNSADRGAVDLSTIPLRQVETIDVIRGGAASARYGSAAVGGVISIRTRRPDADLSSDFSLTAGRYDTLGADGNVSLRRGRFAGLASYERLRSQNDYRFDHGCTYNGGICDLFGAFLPITENTRINADFLRQSGLANGSFETGPSSEAFGTFQLSSTERGQPGVTSAIITPAPDWQVSAVHTSEEYLRGVGSLGWRHSALGPGALEGQLYYRYDRSEFSDPFGEIIRPSAIGFRTELQWIDQAGGGELSYVPEAVELGPLRLSARSHASLRHESLRADFVDDPSRWVSLVSLESELSLYRGRVRLLPALGLDAAWTSETTVANPASGSPITVQPDDGLEAIPQLGVILQLSEAVRLKGNAGRSFRRPTFNELFMPNLGFIRGNWRLEPEKAWNYDAGVELRRSRIGPITDVALQAAWFYRDIENGIEWVQVSNRVREPRNVGEARARGWELEGSLVAFERLELSGSYTQLDSERESTRERLPFSPRKSGFARGALSLGPTRWWAEGSYEDWMYVDETAVFSLDATQQLDLGVTLELARVPGLRFLPGGLTLTSELINATDEQRWEGIGLPLPGRVWYLKLRGRLERRGRGP